MGVSALLARCDLVTRDEYRAKLEAMAFPSHQIDHELAGFENRASFALTAVVQLDDGTEIPWRDDDRGCSMVTFGFGIEGKDTWSLLSREGLTQSVRNGVVDSTVAGLRREWLELAALLRGHGVEVLPEAGGHAAPGRVQRPT
jgi:hypothetical protein